MGFPNSKALELAAEIVDTLSKRVAATLPVVTQSKDSNGNPVITLSADSSPATGEKVVVFRVMPISWPLATDSLGLPARVFTPHVIQLATEKNYEGTTDSVLDILGPAELLPVIAELASRGTRLEWWQEANGTVPSVTTFNTASKLKASYEAHLYFGSKASQ